LNDQKSHPIQSALEQIYALTAPMKGGALASYIPELAQVEPDNFGIALMSSNGRLFTVGDVHVPFTIQSVSKAFSYCLALELIGRQEVQLRVGVEPSGDAFNAIEFDPITRRPYNPMVNAGAITVAGILRDAYQNDAFDAVMERFSKAAGRTLRMNEAVYKSEASTGHRNRAIAHLLCATGVLTEPVDPVVDLYFRLCSIEVTAIDLANMAATLANLGQNPATKVEVFELSAVRDTLSVMLSCGMYDYSGSWIYEVGIPAKSGVGGGLIGVVSRQLGIGSYAPRLDAKGNSVQGVAAFKRLADELGLHMFDCTNTGSAFVDRLTAES
jgi:glutaminase